MHLVKIHTFVRTRKKEWRGKRGLRNPRHTLYKFLANREGLEIVRHHFKVFLEEPCAPPRLPGRPFSDRPQNNWFRLILDLSLEFCIASFLVCHVKPSLSSRTNDHAYLECDGLDMCGKDSITEPLERSSLSAAYRRCLGQVRKHLCWFSRSRSAMGCYAIYEVH